MPSILIIGYDPDRIDYSDPALPPGLGPDAIWVGVRASLKRISDYGWQATQCMVVPDESAAAVVELALTKETYDCVVIGGGIRIAARSVPVFEAILMAIRRKAPATPIAFNTGPDTSLEAAQRCIGNA